MSWMQNSILHPNHVTLAIGRCILKPFQYVFRFILASVYMVTVRVCTLFRYVWKNWSKCLRFRHRTQHAMCRSCFEFKAAIRHAKSIQAQAEAQFEYLEHLNHQYRDRLVYWQLRERAIHNQDLICMIHDGMDRAKFRMPRWGGSGSGNDCRPNVQTLLKTCHFVGG